MKQDVVHELWHPGALRDKESDADDDQNEKKNLNSLQVIIVLAVLFVATEMHGCSFIF